MSIRRKRARFGRAAMGVAAAAAVLGLAPCALAQTPAEESGPLELPSLNIGAGQETANGPVDRVCGRTERDGDQDRHTDQRGAAVDHGDHRRSGAGSELADHSGGAALHRRRQVRALRARQSRRLVHAARRQRGLGAAERLAPAADRLVGHDAQRALCLRTHRGAARAVVRHRGPERSGRRGQSRVEAAAGRPVRRSVRAIRQRESQTDRRRHDGAH